MISLAQARAFGAHLGALHKATILAHDAPSVAALLTVLDTVSTLLPVAAPLTGALRSRAEGVSVTLPTPLGTIVVLSRSASEDAAAYAETVAHECTHAHQIRVTGGAQLAIDYLGSGELRATREGGAYVVGLWVRYLLTGVLPTAEDALASLGSGLYHLDAGELALARGIVESGLATIARGICPPYEVAVESWLWLRQHAPDVIAPELWRRVS